MAARGGGAVRAQPSTAARPLRAQGVRRLRPRAQPRRRDQAAPLLTQESV